MRRWCVKDRNDVWCVAKDAERPDDAASSVETLCGDHITLPHGIWKRGPTCERCRALVLLGEAP